MTAMSAAAAPGGAAGSCPTARASCSAPVGPTTRGSLRPSCQATVVTRYVALLRAVNVGGRNRLPMPALRAELESLGHGEVTTVLQSGNVVLDSSLSSATAIAAGIEERIASAFGLDVTVILRSGAELAGVARRNPFLPHEGELSQLHVAFLADAPAASLVAGLDSDRSPPDAFAVEGREIYLRFPNGSGRSKLTLDWFEHGLGTRATARNWRTVTRLVELVGAQPKG